MSQRPAALAPSQAVYLADKFVSSLIGDINHFGPSVPFPCLQSIKTCYLYWSHWRVRGDKRRGGQPLPASKVKPSGLLIAINCFSSAVCQQKWPNGSKVLASKCSEGSPYQGSSLFEGGLHFFFFLGLLNSKMSPDLLVNKAITEELIGGLFPGTGPQEAAGSRPP